MATDFPDFDSIKVSTKTYTAMTNLNINIDLLFEILPVASYTIVPKKRGRKKKSDTEDPNKDIPEESIITVQYEKKIRGVELKQKKERKKWFRNCLTLVIVLDKNINFKVYKNGTFQMTGCLNKSHSERCVMTIWRHMMDYCSGKEDHSEMYSFVRGDELEVLIVPAMRNIDFSLGFCIDREKLAMYMSTQTDFHCLLETSFGYTGVNIKIPVDYDIRSMMIKKVFGSGKPSEMVPYQEYLDLLDTKNRNAKLKKIRHNTFLVFHSGMTILSGLKKSTMRDTYYEFLSIIKKRRSIIEEKLY